jgi:lipoprotein LprG
VLTRFAALTAALTLTLTACTGDDGGSEDGGDADALAARLATAQQTLDAAETIELSLATKELPNGVTGLLSAKGTGNHTPAFRGTVTVVTGGASLDADVVATGGSVWAKTAFSPAFLTIDPATLKAPDPASLFVAGQGVSGLLPATEDLEDGGRKRDGEDVLSVVEGTLEGGDVQALIPSADVDGSFDVEWRLDEDDALRDATVTGPFYGDEDVTYTITVSTSDEPVRIARP